MVKEVAAAAAETAMAEVAEVSEPVAVAMAVVEMAAVEQHLTAEAAMAMA